MYCPTDPWRRRFTMPRKYVKKVGCVLAGKVVDFMFKPGQCKHHCKNLKAWKARDNGCSVPTKFLQRRWGVTFKEACAVNISLFLIFLLFFFSNSFCFCS